MAGNHGHSLGGMRNMKGTAADALQRFLGRIVLVAGGARGQGLAHSRRLASEGATVLMADVLIEVGEENARKLQDVGLDVRFIYLDVADPESWQHLKRVIEEEHQRVDVLVNNAGVVSVVELEALDLAEWDRILSVNLTGAFLGLQTMLPLLKESASPAVVNTSSIFGPSGAEGYAAYGASKSGLLGLTKVAALEWAPLGIRVNALVPGGVSTELNAAEKDGGVIPETPLGRRSYPDEQAAAVAYLASDDASFVTGAELVVDGGFSTR